MLLPLILTALAMIAFAGNSLLTRAALASGAIDAASFTAIRVVSGAVALAILLAITQSTVAWRKPPGTWPSALALLFYAMAFSFAYLRLGAATGSLVLFASVQATMIVWGMLRRDRPTMREMAGLAIAFVAFIWLVLPGLGTPDAIGFALMIAAGIAWGVYSLRGRGRDTPIAATAGNFARAALICAPLLASPAFGGHATASGVGLAMVSGVVTSGFGYALWYRALPALSTTQAAVVQLTVPVIAALGAVVVLSEALTARLAIASALILGGVALAIIRRKRADNG